MGSGGRRACAFCGGPGLTGEHVWPEWIERLLPGAGDFTLSRSSTRRPGVRTWSTRSLDVRVKQICCGCNTGWMSDLEGAARPLLAPMIRGEPTSVGVSVQQVVATWATKTAMMLCYTTTPPRARPAKQRRWLYEKRTPPPGAVVWLAHYRGTGWGLRSQTHELDLTVVSRPEDTRAGEVSTFTIGALALQVFQVDDIDTQVVQVAIDPAAQPFVLRIWPRSDGPRTWPPPSPLGDADLVPFAQALLSQPHPAT
jgi:hypothetical protein